MALKSFHHIQRSFFKFNPFLTHSPLNFLGSTRTKKKKKNSWITAASNIPSSLSLFPWRHTLSHDYECIQFQPTRSSLVLCAKHISKEECKLYSIHIKSWVSSFKLCLFMRPNIFSSFSTTHVFQLHHKKYKIFLTVTECCWFSCILTVYRSVEKDDIRKSLFPLCSRNIFTSIPEIKHHLAFKMLRSSYHTWLTLSLLSALL